MANSLLKISSSNILNEFLHDCVDDLIRVKQIKFDSYSGEVEWTEKDYKEALHFIQTLYREQALSRSSDFESKVAELESNDAQRAVLGCYGIRETEIAAGIAKELMLRDGGRLVENIDWKLKWVTGSSKFAALREPLLQVDLHCFPTDKNRGRVNFEMTVDAVDTLIKELENAKNYRCWIDVLDDPDNSFYDVVAVW